MTEADFWGLIDRTREEAGGEPHRHIETLEGGLETLPADEIVSFDYYFERARKRAYTWPLWDAAVLIGEGCGDDSFLDFRGWLISKGRAAYEAALADPDSLADAIAPADGDGQIEGFAYAAWRAWERKTGLDASAFPEHLLDGEGQPAGEELEEGDAGALETAYPRLAARFASTGAQSVIGVATRILARVRTMYAPDATYAEIADSEIPPSATARLTQASGQLVRLGLPLLCTYASRRFRDKAGDIVAIRCHVDEGHMIRGLAYVIASRTIFEFESALDDGRILLTSTAEGAASFAALPEIVRETQPYETLAATVLGRHRKRLRDLAPASPVPSMPATPAEAIERSVALSQRKYDVRRASGWLSQTEFAALLRSDDGEARRLFDVSEAYAAFRRLAATAP